MKESYFDVCVNGQLLYKYICNVQKRIYLFWQSSQEGKCFVASKTIATILINNSSLLYTLSEF